TTNAESLSTGLIKRWYCEKIVPGSIKSKARRRKLPPYLYTSTFAMLVFHELQCNIRIKSGKPMAGIYIHIPFCKKACHYCNFHFSTSLKLKNDFLQALLNEMDLRVSYLNGESVSTIYFGGGTPSLLSQQETKTIVDKIRQVFNVLPNAEITLEANP